MAVMPAELVYLLCQQLQGAQARPSPPATSPAPSPQVCPYYSSRAAVPQADVVLAPYSAVLQPEARAALGLQLEGSVLVFDEAHNLLDAIYDAHSAAVTGVRCGSGLRMLHMACWGAAGATDPC